MVTVNTNGSVTMYGTEVITKGIFTWKVRMISFPYSNGYPFVGIFQNDDSLLQQFVTDVDFDQYGYLICAGDGELYAFEEVIGEQPSCIWNENGSVLQMKLDLDKKTLSFKVDDRDSVEAFTDVRLSSTGYRFALSVGSCKGSKFQLVE